MRFNSSHPKKFTAAPDEPYVTVTMTWEEARKYVDENVSADETFMREFSPVTMQMVDGIEKELNNE